MNRQKFRVFILLGVVAVVGIISIQIFWLHKAEVAKAEQFDAKVRSSLATVARQVAPHLATARQPVRIELVGDWQYIVYTNDALDPNVLSSLLKREFTAIGIQRDFVIKLYDCSNQANVCEDYVIFKGEAATPFESAMVAWPEQNLDQYYFGVYFPDGDGLVISSLGIWTFSTAVILLVTLFFIYGMNELLRQRRLSEIQRDFIDAMTHEFKTPLSSISLVGEALLRPELAGKPEKLERYGKIIKQEVARLKDHVETILTNAKDYERRPNLKLEWIDVSQFFKQMQASLAARSEQASMPMQINVEPGLRVLADNIHLWNMLNTLLDNALKYGSPDGRPCTITLSAHTKGRYIQIAVADAGPGMDARTLGLVGQKFYRARHDADAPKGYGLGLFYVKNMMRHHKGRIKITSILQKGTLVTLYFPKKIEL